MSCKDLGNEKGKERKEREMNVCSDEAGRTGGLESKEVDCSWKDTAGEGGERDI